MHQKTHILLYHLLYDRRMKEVDRKAYLQEDGMF